jgi:hypothetical protein
MKWTEDQLTEYLKKRGTPGQPNRSDVSNPPFNPTDILLDLPAPMSVNRSRRIDWNAHKKIQAWKEMADKFLEVAVSRGNARCDRLARYEVEITLSEDHVREDADNVLKLLIDYLRQRDITSNDGKKQMRKLTVGWGHAPAGARLRVIPLPPASIKDVLTGLER